MEAGGGAAVSGVEESVKRISRRTLKEGVWYIEKTGYRGCCDCGLVHYVEYRIKKGKIQARSWRAIGSTEQARKQFRFVCVERKGK